VSSFGLPTKSQGESKPSVAVSVKVATSFISAVVLPVPPAEVAWPEVSISQKEFVTVADVSF
jgi:hypothetical protein